MVVCPYMADTTPICDYEGSDYHARFWQNQGREYEDQVERVALRRLMPPKGDTLLDVGAGFGRLANEYAGYRRVLLFADSRSMLREARQRWGDDPRFFFVAGNWYDLPFVDGLFETLVQFGTLHQVSVPSPSFLPSCLVSRADAAYVLEFANKHNLKAMLRYRLGRQAWSPFDPEPVEFVALNYDFHPDWIRAQLVAAGFAPGDMLAVSSFRLGPLKRLAPTSLLVALDSAMQPTGRWQQLSPSVFVRSRLVRPQPLVVAGGFFACPTCHLRLGEPVDGLLVCANSACGRRWRVEDGVYDFKEPV